MTATLKLRDADRKVREFFDARRSSGEECLVQDENNETVAAVLPAKQYQTYQQYLRRREQNFAVLDRIAAKTKELDPNEIERKITQAVEEVKSKSRPQAKTA